MNFSMNTRRNTQTAALSLCAVLLIVAALASPASAQNATTQPATTKPTTTQPTNDALRQRLAQLAADAASTDETVRTRAVETFTQLHDAMIESLTPHLADDDPEVRARVAVLLADMRREIRLARTLNALGPEQRTQLDALRKSHPKLCQAMLGTSEQDKLAALREVRRLCGGQDGQAYEPLALLGLHSRFASVQTAAIDVILQGDYTSKPVIERLTDIALASETKGHGNFIHIPETPDAPPWPAMKALGVLRSPHTAGRLAWAAWQANRYSDSFTHRRMFLAEAAVAGDDKGLIPSLLPLLNPTAERPVNADDSQFYQYGSDGALYMLLLLTGQSLSEYDLRAKRLSEFFSQLGFDNQAERAAAYDKFKDWWENHKSDPAYQSLTPVELVPGLPSRTYNGQIETTILEFIE